jgi:hypothetical protein
MADQKHDDPENTLILETGQGTIVIKLRTSRPDTPSG